MRPVVLHVHDSRGPVFRVRVADDFEEAAHPRGASRNRGQFVAIGTSTQPSAKRIARKSPASKGGMVIAEHVKGSFPAHIAALKIPPAWTGVIFNSDPSGDLLVVGRDAAGRRQ